MNHSLSVSVIIPVYNRSDYLRIVLNGLCAQTFDKQQMEVIICDDGSTEELRSVVAEYKDRLPWLQYLKQKNQGQAAARNMGTRHCRSNLVFYIDSDVLLDEQLVEQVVAAMDQNPNWVGAEAVVRPVGGETNVLWEAPICEEGGVYLTAALAFRRSVMEQVGGFDETFRQAYEDGELAARVLPLGPIGFVPKAIVEHARRRRTLAMLWKKRKDWKHVVHLAQLHGFVGWPDRPTKWPKLRTLYSALFSFPAGRVLSAMSQVPRSPKIGLQAIGQAAFTFLCGVAAIPSVVTATPPEPRNYLSADTDSGNLKKYAA